MTPPDVFSASPAEVSAMLPADTEVGTSLWKDAWARLRKNKMAVFGAATLLVLCIIAVLTPWIAPYSYEAQLLAPEPLPPSAAHWFGTDTLGRDLLTRVMYGGRISLLVGIVATAVSITIGVLYGAVSGYFGGRVDAIMMRIVDAMFGLPYVIFVVLIMVIFGRSLVLIFAAIGAVEWLVMARIVRGRVLALKKQEFVEACIAQGLTKRRIILRHLIPNVAADVIVYTTLEIPSVMLLESFLSFLGLGVQPPMCSWGSLLDVGVKEMRTAIWQLAFPGFFLSLTLFCLNFLGDGLRDALDPKAAKD